MNFLRNILLSNLLLLVKKMLTFQNINKYKNFISNIFLKSSIGVHCKTDSTNTRWDLGE